MDTFIVGQTIPLRRLSGARRRGYNTNMVRLDHLLSSWKTIREDVALAVEEFPAGELDYRPTPDVDSFRQIARHILNVGHGLSGMMLARETATGQEFRDRMKAHLFPLAEDAGAAEIAAALRQSVAQRCEQFAVQPPEFFDGDVDAPFRSGRAHHAWRCCNS